MQKKGWGLPLALRDWDCEHAGVMKDIHSSIDSRLLLTCSWLVSLTCRLASHVHIYCILYSLHCALLQRYHCLHCKLINARRRASDTEAKELRFKKIHTVIDVEDIGGAITVMWRT